MKYLLCFVLFYRGRNERNKSPTSWNRTWLCVSQPVNHLMWAELNHLKIEQDIARLHLRSETS